MTITLPPLLPLLGIVLGGLAVGFVVWVALSLLATVMLLSDEASDSWWLLVRPGRWLAGAAVTITAWILLPGLL